jgi:succinylglutamate desuccinylase
MGARLSPGLAMRVIEMRITDVGKGSGPRIAIVGCLHGNERLGTEVIGRLGDNPPSSCPLRLVVANEEAMALGKRFVDSDLNRSFPGNRNSGAHEERLAHALLAELNGCDFAIDVHSTTADTEPFAIATRLDKWTLRMLRAACVSKAVLMDPAIADGKSLIDHANGISIEFNKATPAAEAERIVRNTIESIVSGANNEKRLLYAFSILKAPRGFVPAAIPSFSHISAGDVLGYAGSRPVKSEQDFFPVLFGEKEYSGAICIMAREMHWPAAASTI